jgi:hypothetical protein
VIWLDPSLLRTVRELLQSSTGQVGPAFALIDLDDGGLRGAAVDADTGQCLMQLDDHDLQGHAFDRTIADHLVRTGKAPMPENSEWARELLDLMAKARLTLSRSDGTFVMGHQHVGMLRVTRSDLDEALAPAAARAVSLARSIAVGSPAPVTAVVLMPDHVIWPGLHFALGSALHDLPVVALQEDAPLAVPGRHARPEPVVEPAVAAAPAPPALPEPKDRRRQNRLVLVGAALVAALIVVGGTTLVTTPWRDDTGQPRSQRYLSTPESSSTGSAGTGSDGAAPTRTPATITTPPATSDPVLPPINTEAARAPVMSYTTPPPEPPPTTRRTTRPAPAPNTIPNPIPGLPPILLP